MARFALVARGITSTAHTGVELGRRLRAAGHEATFVCHEDVGALAERNGLPFARLTAGRDAFDELWELVRRARRVPRPDAIRAIFRLPIELVRARRRTAVATEFHEVIDRLDPDVIVVDTEAHVAIITAIGTNRPVALTTAMFTVEQRPGVPPMDSTLFPDDPGLDEAWERVRAETRRLRRRRRWSRQGLLDLIAPISATSNGLVPLRAVARRNGVRLRSVARTDGWLRPVWYPDLPTLSTNLEELEFGEGPGPTWTFVGPMVGDDVVRDRDADTSEWDALVEEREGMERPPRLVSCSFGTYLATNRSLLSTLIEVFERRPDWHLVVGLGGRAAPADFEPTPDNVTLLEWAPQREVLAVADAAIVHGGSATLNECLVAGVPMVACSTGFLDQNGVCARIEHAGIGRRIERSASADRFEAVIEEVLDDPSISRRIAKIRDLATAPELRRRAVDELERLAGPAADQASG